MSIPVIESAIDSGTSTSLTGQVTINLGTNANRALWAQLVDPITSGSTLSALTLDGVDIMASVVGPTSMGGFNLYNVHHVTSLTGSKVLLATWGTAGFKSVIAVAFSNADQTTPFSGRQTQYSASGTNPLLTVTSTTNSLVVLGLQAGGGGTLTPGTGSSHIAGVAANFRYALQETGATSTTIDGTFSAQQYWASGASVLGINTAATSITLSGPTSGIVSVPSTNFTVGANGTITGTIIVTPSDGGGGGSFSPTTVSISSGTPTGTFTYTPASIGTKTISVTNNGGLSNPSNISYVVSASATRTVSLSLTTNGSTPSSNLTGLSWAFFDQVSPNSFVAPTAKGTGATTNGSGVFTVTITGTALSAGNTGWLVVTDSDGTITQSPACKSFCAPVIIS